MIEELIGEVAKQGIMGVFLAIVGYALYKKDCTLTKERNERVKDLKEVSEKYIKLVTEINHTLDQLVEIIKRGGR